MLVISLARTLPTGTGKASCSYNIYHTNIKPLALEAFAFG